MKLIVTAIAALSLAGCASITNDANVPVSLSFSNGAEGSCKLNNKRGAWNTEIPATVYIRRSDDGLRYSCKSEEGVEADGMIPSTMGGKIVASAVFLDFGIVDSITDKHREYPSSFVIPMKNK